MTQVSSNQRSRQIPTAMSQMAAGMGDQATKPIPQEDRPDQRVGDEHLGQAGLLSCQRQEGEQDVDGDNGENAPITSTEMERLLGVEEHPGKDQNRREFESQDNAEHQITGLGGSVLVTSTREISSRQEPWRRCQ